MAAKITVVELVAIYGEVLDAGLIADIHAECAGVATACYEQLTMLSGVEPPPSTTTAEGEVVLAHTDGDDGMDSGMGSQEPTYEEGEGEEAVGYDEMYEEALATGEEKAELQRRQELNELMKRKVLDIGLLSEQDRAFELEVEHQRKLGPQSLRSNNFRLPQSLSPHARQCFERMIDREREHCGEFICFYHSYSVVALLYEVHSCISRILYGLPDDFGPMTRLSKKPFKGKPHLRVLLEDFNHMTDQDGNRSFQEVAISCSLSILSPSSEAPPVGVFDQGYHANQVDFSRILAETLKSLGASKADSDDIALALNKVGSRFGYGPVFGGGSGHQLSGQNAHGGHMIQIFLHRSCVDDIAYGCQAYGVYDPNLNPCSTYMQRKTAPDGQARLFWHPGVFLDPKKSRVYHYSANESQMGDGRLKVQRALQKALAPLFRTPESALRAFNGIEGLRNSD